MDIEKAIEYLSQITNEHAEFDKDDFIEFERREKGKAYAIDGSSVKIFDAYAFSVFARRTGYVFADEKGIIERKINEIKLDFIFDENADELNDERRQMEEYEIAEIFSDGIVLMDGCLFKKRENIVGISKKSGQRIGNAPVLFLIKKYGENFLGKKCWYYKIGDGMYAVKFHPHSRFIFRVDYWGDDANDIFSEISSLCNDISCLGYPYPLAEIHKLVKIGKDDAEYIKSSFLKKAIEKGIKIEEIEDLFYDYHEYLEG
ncbi:MAG TPA: DNA double-strand break repair nuclease NurA [Thermoplasmatales archaeon]|nr:DNA double-strand break repair nuclease NurA [Thermoplasmatales archaeon]